MGMNNEEFVIHCMNFSQYGALRQMWMIEMLLKVAQEHANIPDEEVEQPKAGEGKIYVGVNLEAWRGCAREFIEDYNLKMGGDIPTPWLTEDQPVKS